MLLHPPSLLQYAFLKSVVMQEDCVGDLSVY